MDANLDPSESSRRYRRTVIRNRGFVILAFGGALLLFFWWHSDSATHSSASRGSASSAQPVAKTADSLHVGTCINFDLDPVSSTTNPLDQLNALAPAGQSYGTPSGWIEKPCAGPHDAQVIGHVTAPAYLSGSPLLTVPGSETSVPSGPSAEAGCSNALRSFADPSKLSSSISIGFLQHPSVGDPTNITCLVETTGGGELTGSLAKPARP